MKKIFCTGFLLAFSIGLYACGMRMGWPDYTNTTSTSTSTSTSDGSKRIFVSSSTSAGNFAATPGFPAGADSLCAADTNKPSTGTYRAMVVDGSLRVGEIGQQNDWVLRANTTYRRADGTVIGTTSADAVFTFTLDSAMGTAADFVWTGLNADWTTGNTCTAWTTTAGNGNHGTANNVNTPAIFTAAIACTGTYHFYCVEQ